MFLCKYYIVTSDVLVASSLDVLFLFLTVILSELHEKPRRKDWATEIRAEKNGHPFEGGTSLFWLDALLFMSIYIDSSSTPSSLSSDEVAEWTVWIYLVLAPTLPPVNLLWLKNLLLGPPVDEWYDLWNSFFWRPSYLLCNSVVHFDSGSHTTLHLRSNILEKKGGTKTGR